MKSASAGLISLLNTSKEFLMADLFTFTLVDGSVLRYTSADIDLVYGGNTFKKFRIARGRIRTTIGVEVDELKVVVNAATTDLIGAATWSKAVRTGALDGAHLQLERIFMPSWGDTSLGTIKMFGGRVSNIEMSRTVANLTVKSELELLDVKLPRNLYQSGCMNTLFDDSCGLNRASFAVTGTVTTASAVQVNSALGQATDYFTLGKLQMTSGANNGVIRTVRLFAGGSFTLSIPFDVAPAPGDHFTAWPGCDRLKATCESSKFNNIVNFRGYPFVPDPETAT